MTFPTEIGALYASFVSWLPSLVAVIVILIIGFVVASLLKSATAGALRRLGFDEKLNKSPANNIVRRLTNSPSLIVGKTVYWLAVIVTVSVAIGAMNIPVFNQFLIGIYGYVPNIIAAIIIFALALAAATAVSAITIRLMGDTPTGRIISTIVPALIITIAGFAILEQLQIASVIVTITYAAIWAALALGFGLAFGLGGKEVAGRLFDQAYEAGRKNADQIKRDFQKGKERGEREVRERKEDIEKDES